MSVPVQIIINARDSASPQIRNVSESLRDMGGAAESGGSKLRSLVGVLAGAGLGALAGFGAAIAGAGAAGLSMNNSLEQTTARLNAFTKDGAKSAEILEMIKQRAAATPFEFEQMASAAASLLPASKASGKSLEELIATAEILAASNPAEGLEGAAFSLREALSGDFVSIVERFNIPRQRLNELKEQGVPAIEAIRIAMQEMGLDADLVSSLAGTMTGRWSTFKDTLVNVAATATKPIFDALSGSLASVNDWLSASQPLLDQVGATIAGAFSQAIAWLSNTGLPMLVAGWQALQPSLQAAGDVLTSVVLPAIGSLVSWFQSVLPQAIAFVNTHWEAFKGALIAVGAVLGGALVLGAIISIGATLATLVSPIGLVIAAAALLGAAWSTNFLGIRDTLTQFWETTARPAFEQLVAWLQINIPVAIQTVSAFWTTTLQPALAAVWTFIQGSVIPALGQVAQWLATNIPVAIQAAANFWTTTLQPALAAVWAFIQGSVIPILSSVVQWLATNIPIAIQAAATFWTTTLQPALAAVWSFIQSSVIPILSSVVQWLGTNIPAAISTVSNFWTGTLKPAIEQVWAFIQGSVLPLLNALGNVLTAVVGLAVRTLANEWETKLKPALSAVWGFIKTNLIPIFEALVNEKIAQAKQAVQALSDLWNGPFGQALRDAAGLIVDMINPALGKLYSFVSDAKGGFEGIADAISGAVDWLKRLADSINSLPSLPDVLTPGSPTPFETGLRGIASALREVSATELPRFNAELQQTHRIAPTAPALPRASLSAAAPVSSSITNNYTLNYAGHSATDGDVRDALRLQSLLMGSF